MSSSTRSDARFAAEFAGRHYEVLLAFTLPAGKAFQSPLDGRKARSGFIVQETDRDGVPLGTRPVCYTRATLDKAHERHHAIRDWPQVAESVRVAA